MRWHFRWLIHDSSYLFVNHSAIIWLRKVKGSLWGSIGEVGQGKHLGFMSMKLGPWVEMSDYDYAGRDIEGPTKGLQLVFILNDNSFFNNKSSTLFFEIYTML